MRESFLFISFILLLFSNSLKAQPLSGILPKNQAYEYSSTPTIYWNDCVGAIDYTVQLSQDATFTIGVIQSPSLSVTTWTTIPLGYGLWYWKIVANTISGVQSSLTNIFTIYDPSQNSNLTLWLKADAGLTLDVSSNVQTWTDLSPNAHVLNQSNPAKRPGINLLGLNNLPSLNFTGSQVLDGGDILDIGLESRSMFIIGKVGASNQTLFAKSKAAFASNRYALLKDGVQTAFIYHESLPNHIYSAYNSINYSLYSIVSSRLVNKNRFEVNNTLLGMSNLSASYNFNSTYRFLIGAYNNGNDDGELLMLNGNISEMVFINSADSSEILKAENYLRYKYSPPIDLGKDSTLNNFCSINLTPTSGFTNLLWSTGETTPSISVNQSDQYWVEGTDIFGFVSRDTIQVNYPQISIPAITGICSGNSITWNADLGPGYTYLWSPNGETTPSISITTPGTYSVQATDASLCTKNSGNVTFTLDTYSQTTFLGNDTTLCSGNLIALQVGASETYNYLWPDASIAPFYTVDTTGNYFVETINGNGCVAQDTIHVTVSGTAPVADFYFQNQCFGSSSDFTDQSVPVPTDLISLWSWDMGDGTIISSQSPTYTYAATGTYNVQLYVESEGGCGAFHTESVSVFVLPTPGFTYTGHCSDQTIQFVNTSTGAGAISSYFWDFDMPWMGAYNNSIVTVPNRIFDLAGTYNVTLMATDVNACVGTVILPVVIDESPVSSFSATNACENVGILFSNSSSGGPSPNYFWDFGNGISSILPSPTQLFTTVGVNTISLTVTAQNGCIDDSLFQIEIYPNPIAQFTPGPHCKGTYMDLIDLSTVVSGNIDSSMWIINTNDTIYGLNSSYLVDLMGQNEIILTTYTDQGCSATASTFIDVTSELTASFDAGVGVVATGEAFQFTNTSLGSGISLWNFGDGSFSTDSSPSHIYSDGYADSSLSVFLIEMNMEGCIDTAYQTIHIERAYLDLEVENMYLQKENDMYQVGVKLINRGSVTIAEIDLFMFSQKGFLYEETWNGTLGPLSEFIYVFIAKPSSFVSDQDLDDAFLCIEGIGYDVNSNVETNLDNNKSCRNIEGGNVVLIPIAPNPASGSIEIQLIVSKDSELEVGMYDDRGRLINKVVPKQQLSAGFYTYSIDLNSVEAGTYFIRMNNSDFVKQEKIIVLGE